MIYISKVQKHNLKLNWHAAQPAPIVEKLKNLITIHQTIRETAGECLHFVSMKVKKKKL